MPQQKAFNGTSLYQKLFFFPQRGHGPTVTSNDFIFEIFAAVTIYAVTHFIEHSSLLVQLRIVGYISEIE